MRVENSAATRPSRTRRADTSMRQQLSVERPVVSVSTTV